MPVTSRTTVVHPITLREVQIARVVELTPGMRRVTLAGPQLCAFTSANGLPQPGFRSDGFDDEIRLVFAHPGQSEPLLPVQLEGSIRPPEGGRVLSRPFSVRRWDAAAGELEVDFVTHGVGVAADWVARAVPGDSVHLFGPLISRALPIEGDWLLVAGDETALPAIARLLEELDETSRALVFIEIADPNHRQPLRELPGVKVTWLVRAAGPAGESALLDAIRSAHWPEGRVFAWIAGEQAVVRDLRRHLVAERQVPKSEIDFTGYWRRGPGGPGAPGVSGEPGDDAAEALIDPAVTAAQEQFHELAEIVPPIAIRVAVALGLGELIGRGVDTPAALAAETGSDERALGKLLRYLHALGLLATISPADRDPEEVAYELSEVGAELAEESWIRQLHPGGAAAGLEAGIHGLAASVRTGGAAYAAVTGRTFAELRSDQRYDDAYLDLAAEHAELLAGTLARSGALDGIAHLVLHSDGAGVQARELLAARPELRVTVCALPTHADWLRRGLAASVPEADRRSRLTIVEQSIFEAAPAADAVLLIGALAAHPDADAAHVLRRSAATLAPGGRILLLEDTFGAGAPAEHDAERDLLALTRDGSGLRTEAELRGVIDHAGLRILTTHTIGWGDRLHQLVPRAQPSPETQP